MRRVGIKVLKNKLSEFVRAAEAGETVLVTDRSRIVAELVPPRRHSDPCVETVLEMGARDGWYTPPTLDWADFVERMDSAPAPDGEVAISFETLMEGLARDREDR